MVARTHLNACLVITETECVYCAVRTEYQIVSSLKDYTSATFRLTSGHDLQKGLDTKKDGRTD
jgi:hypothetical protein